MPKIHVGRQMLDKHFISAALGEEVTEFRIRKGSPLDDSVVSNLLSLDVRLSSGDILHLIYKCMNPTPVGTKTDSIPPEVLFREALEGYPIEIQFYTLIAPALSSLPSNPALPALPLPKLYSSGTEPYEGYLLLEDLRPAGFKTGEKFKGLGPSEVNLVLSSLARMHAQSYVLLQKEPKTKIPPVYFEKHPLIIRLPDGTSISCKEEDIYKGIKTLLQKTAPELSSKMEKYEGHVLSTLMEPWHLAKKGDPDYFRILAHGDLWLNNILFLYDGVKGPEEVRFIDFQQVRCTSIYEDLHYFLFNSTTPQFRREGLTPALDIYFDNFAEALGVLGCKMPQNFTKESLKLNYEKTLPSGFCYFVFAIGFQLGEFAPPPSPMETDGNKFNDFQEKKSLEEIVRGQMDGLVGAITNALGNSPRGLKRLVDVVQEMVLKGVL